MSKTIDEIIDTSVPLSELVKEIETGKPVSVELNRERFKQALREAILTEVIGDHNWYSKTDYPVGTPYHVPQSELRRLQRQRLDAWLGIEEDDEPQRI